MVCRGNERLRGAVHGSDADSGGCQRQDRIYSRAAGRTADSGSGSTESEGNIRFRRNGRGAVIFRRGVSVLSDVVGESAVRIPTDLCQRTEPDGKVCTGEDRVCQ